VAGLSKCHKVTLLASCRRDAITGLPCPIDLTYIIPYFLPASSKKHSLYWGIIPLVNIALMTHTHCQRLTLSHPVSTPVHPLFSCSHLSHIYQGRKPKGDAVVVGCLLCFHAPLDGRGADQALVENRVTSFHANSEYLMNNVKCNQEQFRTINHNNVY
jgi:hypothetical protein